MLITPTDAHIEEHSLNQVHLNAYAYLGNNNSKTVWVLFQLSSLVHNPVHPILLGMHRRAYIYAILRLRYQTCAYARERCAVLRDKWAVFDTLIDFSPFIETSDSDEFPDLVRGCPYKS